jgi:hypothetical protein
MLLPGDDFEERNKGRKIYAFVVVAIVMNIDRPARLIFVNPSII